MELGTFSDFFNSLCYHERRLVKSTIKSLLVSLTVKKWLQHKLVVKTFTFLISLTKNTVWTLRLNKYENEINILILFYVRTQAKV